MKQTIAQFFLAGTALLLFATSAFCGSLGAMPEFSLPSALDGKVVNSKDYKGKVLLVTFFATWCPPCRQEVPTLIKLQNEYGQKGFSVIGLSVDEKGPKIVLKMIKKDKINYPVLMAKGKTARDFGGVVGIPTSFLIDRQGNITKRDPGDVPKALFDKDINKYL